MKAVPKNWLLPGNRAYFFNAIRMGKWLILIFAFTFSINSRSQIANYVNNGSFEDCVNCDQNFQLLVARYWGGIDTNKFFGFNLSALPPTGHVPYSSFTYQWPRHGNNYYLCTFFFKPNTPQTSRGYPRNRLKENLQAGKTYCVKIYYNVTNQSSYGIDGIGAYFGDSTLDTISQCDKPITFLTPQIQNPNNNIITDTLNWSLLTGTFVANGTEKYMLLGNFKSDIATNSVMINPANLPVIFTDFLFDDISVIDMDLNADAGFDSWQIPGDSSFIGRQPDVGIDEACTWYQLPNMTTPIDTVAGLWVKPVVTTTYVVKQDICGNIKWDTVVVHQSALGITEQEQIKNNLVLFPNPAIDKLTISFTLNFETDFNRITIHNNLGQLVKEEEISFKNKKVDINTIELTGGIYLVTIHNSQNESITKKLVITK